MERKSKGEGDRGRRKTGREAGERESEGTSHGIRRAQTCTAGQNEGMERRVKQGKEVTQMRGE